MDFSEVLYHLKAGAQARRTCWQSSMVYLSADVFVYLPYELAEAEPWTPSVSDLLANDWVIV